MGVINKWHKATEDVAKVFTKKYFPFQKYGKDTYWVADEVGGVFFVSDYFFNVDRMLEALILKATIEQLIDYYDAELENCMSTMEPLRINFRNYVKYGMVN